MRNQQWLAPLTGMAFVIIGIASFGLAGEPPDAGEPVREIVGHYADNKQSVVIAAALETLAATCLVFFGACLRRALIQAEGQGGILPDVALAGTVVMAVGIAIDATIAFALAATADDLQPAGVQALQGLWDHDFFPVALGSQLTLLAAGIAIVLHGALPRWLGYVALGLGLVGITPIGFAAVAGGAVWIVIVSVLLTGRGRTGEPAGRSIEVASHAGA